MPAVQEHHHDEYSLLLLRMTANKRQGVRMQMLRFGIQICYWLLVVHTKNTKLQVLQ